MSEERETVVADGGPLNGRELDVEPDAGEIVVTMADGNRHRYTRSREHPGGARWAGRVRE